jgi:hypothetical protein
MNQPTDPPNPTPIPQPRATPPGALPPPPIPPSLGADAGAGLVLESLLKRPAHLIAELQRPGSARLVGIIALAALLSLGAYGLVIGSFSGHEQWLAAPLKVSLGMFASALICLPSLFIFTCLMGAEITFRGVVGTLSTMLALIGLLLIGFAPVAWVFSQSTDSLVFMGMLHLIFWFIAALFGVRLLGMLMDQLRVTGRFHVGVWVVIFLLVNLQMITALRPIIGRAPTLLPTEKKFFLAHWAETVNREN